MFSLNQRFQNVTNTALTFVVLLIGLVIAITQFQLSFHNKVYDSISLDNFKINNINTGLRSSRMYGGTNKQNLKMHVALETDLSSLWTWNTKQVFVYLTGEYVDSKDPAQSGVVTLWDKIITDKKDAVLQYKNLATKYSVWDKNGQLKDNVMNFKLQWNIQPYIGSLNYGELNIPSRVLNNTILQVPDVKRKATA